MAVYRPTPKCSFCGKLIAKAIYDDQSDLPMSMRLIGDTFIRWDYFEHSCKGKRKAMKDMPKINMKGIIGKINKSK